MFDTPAGALRTEGAAERVRQDGTPEGPDPSGSEGNARNKQNLATFFLQFS